MRPGIVAVSLSAYGHAGPWAGAARLRLAGAERQRHQPRRGRSRRRRQRPKELPAQALDHATGYLMAFGAMMALARKAREGGSWHVRVSLAQTAHWLTSLGRLAERLRLPRSQARRRRRPAGRDGHAARPPDLRQARRGAVRDAGPLGPPARCRSARTRRYGRCRRRRLRTSLATRGRVAVTIFGRGPQAGIRSVGEAP